MKRKQILSALLVIAMLSTLLLRADAQPLKYSSESYSRDARYEINVFLSNFAEQWFNETSGSVFSVGTTDTAAVVNFACKYNEINVPGNIRYDSGCATIGISELNNTLDRFFGFRYAATDLYNAGIDLRNNRVYFPANGGETHTHFAVMSGMDNLKYGLKLVRFAIYQAEMSNTTGAGGSISNRELYYLSSSQASSRRDITWFRTGTAIVEPYVYNGRNTYRLVSYDIDVAG